jgi:exodeoxyribonuclease III
VNGLKSVIEKRRKDFTGAISKEDPDLVFLQETKLQAGMTSKYAECIEHYTQSHFTCSTGKKGHFGAAVFAKKDLPIKGCTFGLGEFLTDDEGRAITVEFEHFYFVGLYVANSGQGLARLRYRIETYDAAVRNYLAELSKTKPVILGGDLNVAHKDLDVYNFDAPHIKKQAGCNKEERDSFTLLLESQNRVDSFRFLYPESRVFSFWSVRAGNRPFNKGLRLDYFVAPREMMDPNAPVRLFDSWILDDVAETVSDHAPVCCQVIVPKV